MIPSMYLSLRRCYTSILLSKAFVRVHSAQLYRRTGKMRQLNMLKSGTAGVWRFHDTLENARFAAIIRASMSSADPRREPNSLTDLQEASDFVAVTNFSLQIPYFSDYRSHSIVSPIPPPPPPMSRSMSLSF